MLHSNQISHMDGRAIGAWSLENTLTNKSKNAQLIVNNNSSPTSSVSCVVGKYSIGQFDTNKSISAYSAIGSSLVAQSNWSCDMWIRTTDLSARNTFMSWTRNGISENGFSIETDGSINFWLGGPASAFRAQSAAGVITVNNWYHVHAYGVTSTGFYVWINGVSVANWLGSQSVFQNLVSLQFGQYTLGGDYLKGQIKNIRFCVPGMSNPNPAF